VKWGIAGPTELLGKPWKTVRCPEPLPCANSDLDPRIGLAVGYSRGSLEAGSRSLPASLQACKRFGASRSSCSPSAAESLSEFQWRCPLACQPQIGAVPPLRARGEAVPASRRAWLAPRQGGTAPRPFIEALLRSTKPLLEPRRPEAQVDDQAAQLPAQASPVADRFGRRHSGLPWQAVAPALANGSGAAVSRTAPPQADSGKAGARRSWLGAAPGPGVTAQPAAAGKAAAATAAAATAAAATATSSPHLAAVQRGSRRLRRGNACPSAPATRHMPHATRMKFAASKRSPSSPWVQIG
jgi:hypothetical protein